MGIVELIRIKKILEKYQGKPLVLGEDDCSLMVAEIFEPDVYNTLHGRYTSVRGASRVLNTEYGVSCVKSFFERDLSYRRIDYNFKQSGDIIINDIDICIWLGDMVFGVDENQTFNVFPIPSSNDPSDLIIFRKE